MYLGCLLLIAIGNKNTSLDILQYKFNRTNKVFKSVRPGYHPVDNRWKPEAWVF